MLNHIIESAQRSDKTTGYGKRYPRTEDLQDETASYGRRTPRAASSQADDTGGIMLRVRFAQASDETTGYMSRMRFGAKGMSKRHWSKRRVKRASRLTMRTKCGRI